MRRPTPIPYNQREMEPPPARGRSNNLLPMVLVGIALAAGVFFYRGGLSNSEPVPVEPVPDMSQEQTNNESAVEDGAVNNVNIVVEAPQATPTPIPAPQTTIPPIAFAEPVQEVLAASTTTTTSAPEPTEAEKALLAEIFADIMSRPESKAPADESIGRMFGVDSLCESTFWDGEGWACAEEIGL